MTVMQHIGCCGIVPVIVLNAASHAAPVARALLAGGIDVMEITFRTAAARDAIAAVASEVPEMLVGAGTVVTVQQIDDAVRAGAKFVVSPGSDADIIRHAQALDIPILPGIVTPSELMAGLKLGIEVFKFFPSENYGGLKTIKALAGPFPHVKFVPTGGISDKNAADYFASKYVHAVGGSWMATGDMIADGRYDEISEKTELAVALMRSARA